MQEDQNADHAPTGNEERLRALIEAPTLARRLYPRGGVEGLEANTMQVLIAVQLMGRPTVSELVAELALAKGTVSTALATLEREGLVAPAKDAADGRRQLHRITANGRALVARFGGFVRGTPPELSVWLRDR